MSSRTEVGGTLAFMKSAAFSEWQKRPSVSEVKPVTRFPTSCLSPQQATVSSAARQRGNKPNLMEVMRLLMESETVLEWPASIDQVGGSLGLSTSDRAVSRR